jgi:hypothetical protein
MLQTQFEGHFGKGKVQVLPIKEINRSELNPQIAYFQIGINRNQLKRLLSFIWFSALRY